jgi:hypothetical protein
MREMGHSAKIMQGLKGNLRIGAELKKKPG